MGRIFGLDVMRAVAIGLVLFNHYGGHVLRDRGVRGPITALANFSGFYGVELFFGLSGFLIGRLLIEIVERGPIHGGAWLRFMLRRWMRTVPLNVVWVMVLLLLAPPPAHPSGTALRYLFFVQNLVWPMADSGWFSVSWSLAVEEWFYLLFSAILLLLAVPRRLSAVPLAVLVFVTAIPIIRLLGIPEGAPFDSHVRKVVFFRLDAIAYGVGLAWLWTQRADLFEGRRALLWFGAGAFGLLSSVALITHVDTRPLWLQSTLLSLTGVSVAATLPGFLRAPAPVRLWAEPVRWMSERSYGLYIVHLSVLVFAVNLPATQSLGSLPVTLAALLVSCVLAELSFRFVESPVLRRRPRQFVVQKPTPAVEAGQTNP